MNTMTRSNVRMPFPTELTQSSVSRSTQVADQRSREATLHYTLRIPSNWRQLESHRRQVHRATDFLELARYGTTEHARIGMTVSCLTLPRECGASEWLAIDQERHRKTVLERRDHYTSAGSIPDVLTISDETDGASVCRTTVLKDGSRLLKLECRAPAESYSGLAEAFLVAVTSFKFLQPAGTRCAEPLNSFPFDSDKRILLPDSWALVSRSASGSAKSLNEKNGVQLEFELSAEGSWAGTLIIASTPAISKASDQLRHSHLERLRNQGLSFSRLNLNRVDTSNSAFSEAWFFQPELSGSNRAKYSAPFLILINASSVYLLAMLSVASEQNPEWYAICKRAFEIARDSLTVLDTESSRG